MADRFTKECSRLVCLQLASMAGFDVVSSGSLDVLSDVMETYVQELCKTTRSYAEGAGRTEVNAEDLALGLGDVGTSLSSVREFKQSLKGEVPFTTTVPQYPVAPPVTKKTSFRDAEEARPAHIPDFLPKFPPRHTYIHTSVFPKHQDDSREKALRAHDAKKAAEDVLVRLGQGARAVDNPFVASLLDATQPDPAEPVSSQPETTAPTQGDCSKKSDEWTSILLEKGERKSAGLSVALPFHMDPLAILGAAISSGGKKKRTRDAFEEKDKSQKRSKGSNVDLSLFQFNIQEGHGEGSRDVEIRGNDPANNGNPGAISIGAGGDQVGSLIDNGGANTETTVNGRSKHGNFVADKSGLANGSMKEDTGSDEFEGPTVSQKVEDRTDEAVDEGEEADIKAQEDRLMYGVVRNNEEEEEEDDYPSEDAGQEGPIEDEFASDDVEREPMGEEGEPQEVDEYDNRDVEGYIGGGVYGDDVADNVGDPEEEEEEKEPPLVSGLFLDFHFKGEDE